MFEIPEKYITDPDFREFLNREFGKTAVDSTMEELAEFAFGSIDTTIEAFEERIKNES
jgi:cytochrome c peroxidase